MHEARLDANALNADGTAVFTFGPDKSGIPGGATEADVILYLHNNVRENFPDLKPLTWSTDLAASARKIAETCPLRESDATPYGESVYSMATTDRDAYNFLIGVIGSPWYSTEVSKHYVMSGRPPFHHPYFHCCVFQGVWLDPFN